MIKLGVDVGTYNLVVSRRKNENEIAFKKEVNAFLEIPLENSFMYNMMKASGVPIIKKDNLAYAIGESAVNIAYAMKGVELKRPMKDGCVNPHEKSAFNILQAMIHSLVGELEEDALLHYSVPANAVNEDTDADYHQKVLQSIFDSYSIKGKKIKAKPINEALALVYAELKEKAYTGLGISLGAGQLNICYAMYANPLLTFSIVNSGDWIDKQAAKVTVESIAFINKEKTKINLLTEPNGLVERAIKTQYLLMIEKSIKTLKENLEKTDKIKVDDPVDIILGGGTASPNGFVEVFKKTVDDMKLPIPIGEIRRPLDHLYSVSKGCLIASENSEN